MGVPMTPTFICTRLRTSASKVNAPSTMLPSPASTGPWMVLTSDLSAMVMSCSSSCKMTVVRIHLVPQTLLELLGPLNIASSAGQSMESSPEEHGTHINGVDASEDQSLIA